MRKSFSKLPVAPRLACKCSSPPKEKEEGDDELAFEGSVSMADTGEGGGGAKTTRCAINSGTPLKRASRSNYSVRMETEKD